ncbi:MAG: nucleoside monophosphate kinase [Candidatus Doudnabacteria bacterium]|nr:nucleoside monophosphate kinase [bacterium]MDZ4243990.1 nucleoside monophosphate kinase [Candidatus Doudnabacteria bacterium]
MKVSNLVILGPQGSGKDTQADLLAKEFGFVVIGAGNELREIAKTDTQLGKKVNQTINVEGRLVEPELIVAVIEDRLSKIPPDQSIVVHGFPRSLRQYELMKASWVRLGRRNYKVIFIELPEEEALKRIGGRGRVDDHPEALKKRFELFNSETMPVVRQLENEKKLISIDGSPSIEKVQEEIVNRLGLK